MLSGRTSRASIDSRDSDSITGESASSTGARPGFVAGASVSSLPGSVTFAAAAAGHDAARHNRTPPSAAASFAHSSPTVLGSPLRPVDASGGSGARSAGRRGVGPHAVAHSPSSRASVVSSSSSTGAAAYASAIARTHTPTVMSRVSQAQQQQLLEAERQQLLVRLQDTLERMTTAVLVALPDDPIVFLVDFLARLQADAAAQTQRRTALGL